MNSSARPDDVVAFVMDCAPGVEAQPVEKLALPSSIKTVNKSLQLSYETVGSEPSTKLPASSPQTKSGGPTTAPVYWVHMMDLSSLSIIADELKLDPLVCDHFLDLRFHSMMTPMLGGCCMAVCYFMMDALTMNVSVYKLYFYMARGLMLTYAAELMPAEEDEADGGGGGDIGGSISSSRGGGGGRFTSSAGAGVGAGATESRGEGGGGSPRKPVNSARMLKSLVSSSSSQHGGALSDAHIPIDHVFNAVLDRWQQSAVGVAARTLALGPVNIFYEMASEALAAQDTLMEFMSRTMFHFKKSTGFRLPYRKKVHLVKRLHIVNTAINSMEQSTAKALSVVRKLVDAVREREISHANAPAGMSSYLEALVPSALLGVRHLPLLLDLVNSYEFVHGCLASEANEVVIIRDAVDMVSSMRADHTALVLSLIATIFLPATFLTGVFGMNFQEHGGYTIDIVNSKYGPYVFYILCVVLAISLIAYYVTMGWMEAFGVVRYLLNYTVGKKAMMRVLGNDFQEDVNDDPAVKDPKMVALSPSVTQHLMSENNTGYNSRSSSHHRENNHSRHVTSGEVRNPVVGSGDQAAAAARASPRHGGTTTPVAGAGAGLFPPHGSADQMLVPQRVAEALEEEVRRLEETRRRRCMAQLRQLGDIAEDAGGGGGGFMAAHGHGHGGRLHSTPSLQQRANFRTSRLSQAGSATATAAATAFAN
jgi:hypothetical protein